MAAALDTLTVNLRWKNREQVEPFLNALADLMDCVALDLERMDAGPRSRIEARLKRLRETYQPFCDSLSMGAV